jgi:poly [ADP-ribose] polymerase
LDKELPNETIKQLIEDNEQFLKGGRDDSLNFLTDIMFFGPLAKCPECKNGQLVYR